MTVQWATESQWPTYPGSFHVYAPVVESMWFYEHHQVSQLYLFRIQNPSVRIGLAGVDITGHPVIAQLVSISRTLRPKERYYLIEIVIHRSHRWNHSRVSTKCPGCLLGTGLWKELLELVNRAN